MTLSISPPRPKGPPLNALRAFESAARHGSFTLAADELCVTPGAIAQHVKTLESWAGAKLFKRRAHGVKLTSLGAKVLPAFVTAFDHLGGAAQSLRAQATPDQIRIAALPSVAQLWLSPRLPGIRARYSDLSISVYASEIAPNLKREQFDLSIFFEDLPGDSRHIEVCRDSIFPVCSPQLATRITDISDLNKLPCLHDASWSTDWHQWLQVACPELAIDTQGPGFSLYSLMLEEARNSAGIMIGHKALVQDQLDSGALVMPFSTEVMLSSRLAIATQAFESKEEILQDIIAALVDPAD